MCLVYLHELRSRSDYSLVVCGLGLFSIIRFCFYFLLPLLLGQLVCGVLQGLGVGWGRGIGKSLITIIGHFVKMQKYSERVRSDLSASSGSQTLRAESS